MRSVKSIASIFFAVLVMFSSTSFMVGLHLCSGHVQSLAIFSKAEGCAMEKMLPACKMHAAKPCCEDETIVHQGEDFKIDASSIFHTTLAPIEMMAPPVLVAEVIPSVPNAKRLLYHYDPPLPSTDRTVSFGAFLIWFSSLFRRVSALLHLAILKR